MTEPLRWIDPRSDAEGFERDVLEADSDVEVPPGASDEVWQNLLLTLVPPAGGGDGGSIVDSSASGLPGASGTAAAAVALKQATLAGAVKGFVVGGCAGVLIAGGGSLLVEGGSPARAARSTPTLVLDSTRHEPAKPAAIRDDGPSQSVTPTPVSGGPATLPEKSPKLVHQSEPPSARSVAAFEAPGSAEQAKSQLKEEAEMIRQARAALRDGDLARAYAILEASRARFPSPALVPEREALTIELLLRSGQRGPALERARAFLQNFPESPHANELRELLAAE